MEGPGACNNRFGYISEDKEFSETVIEIINTTPGSLYSTAVLFPKRRSQFFNNNQISDIGDEVIETTKEEEEDENENEEDTDVDREDRFTQLSQSEEDDLCSLSQRFPNTMGISCCIDSLNEINNSDNFSIVVSGRYYTKIIKTELEKILVLINEQYSEFALFFSKYENILSPYFKLNKEGISASKDFRSEFFIVKRIILDINLKIAEEIAKQEDDDFDPIFKSISSKYRYLSSYKEKLWNHLKSPKSNKDRHKSTLDKNSYIKIIYRIELYETFLSYLEDVLSLYNSKSFGYWKAHSFSKRIDLSNIDFNSQLTKVIYSPHKYSNLKNIINFQIEDSVKVSLSVWLQVTKDSRDNSNNNRYIKVQLENTSTEFIEDTKHYFSIVTEKVNQRCFFGVEIKIVSKSLVAYRKSDKLVDVNDDVDKLNYLYRSIDDYGIGHFCSVDWGIEKDLKYIKSEFIPSYETPDVEPIPRDKNNFVLEGNILVPKSLLEDTKALEFKWLSTFSEVEDELVVKKLLDFVDAYGRWIDSLNEDDDNNEFATQNINSCCKDYERMRTNIETLLKNNQTNIKSFRIMNSAMFIQLWHSKNSADNVDINFYKNASDYLFGEFSATWRPFQIAFILLNLDGIFQRSDDPNWDKRNELVDLVWFPTGGGKTEAYLGIIALTIINRRITEPETLNGGTTAIMRYTLRLLATQQFQRAMLVILALEQIRLWGQNDLGNEPISIGLFVGDSSLPNHAEGLLKECEHWRDKDDEKSHQSKIPLDKCPWCGELLEYGNYGSSSNPDIKFRCKNTNCSFKSHFPVVLCDDYIYDTPPTLLFGTVDKFAAIAHNVSNDKSSQDSRRIFGKGKLNNLTPDLIIQDELHLLLGPLGSAVSLFESAVDQLCTRDKIMSDGSIIKIRPKIISSTATTRNTELQIRALYDRDVNIFPKNGINYDDSFFAFYKRKQVDGITQYISKRKYIGILPTGRTQMTTQMRLAATIFVHRALFEKEHINLLFDKEFEKAADFYYSIISYFNSLKEVGKTDAQFYTEFTKYTRRLFKRVLRYSDMLECFYAYDSSFSKSELTGRLSGSEVVDQLKMVGKEWLAKERLPYPKSEIDSELQIGHTPPDYILATNMISVGLDVDRFNTIIMNSMPRNIAEYIQASSRVARNDYGLVVTLHNPFRSRDLSHFERFREFHEKLYFYVEPISITPFSKKSIEKYLPLYLATMIRHSFEDLADKNSAGNMDQNKCVHVINELQKYFKNRLYRAQQLDESQKDLLNHDLEQNIQKFINQAINEWEKLAKAQTVDNYKLIYSGAAFIDKYKRNNTIPSKDLFLSLDSYKEDKRGKLWNVPQSLRTVDAEAVIKIKDNN